MLHRLLDWLRPDHLVAAFPMVQFDTRQWPPPRYRFVFSPADGYAYVYTRRWRWAK